MPIGVVPYLESVDEGGDAVKGVFHPFLGGFHPMGKIHESFPRHSQLDESRGLGNSSDVSNSLRSSLMRC
jgi:hypothetical protein